MARKSRLYKHIESRSKRNLALSILLLIVLSLSFVKFGIPLFAQVGLFISGFKNTTEVKKHEKVFIASPVLDSLPNATNSAQIAVSGKGDSDMIIKIYVNGNVSEETRTDSKGIFSTLVILTEKDNSVKVKEYDGKDNSSDFSDPQYVSYITQAPNLELKTPTDGQKFTRDDKAIPVTGTTTIGARVTVNDFVAIVDDSGNFSYNLALHDGDNDIKVVATDEAGNKTEKSIKVNYSP